MTEASNDGPAEATLIRGGLVADGTGGPLRRADVLVAGGRVSDVVDPGLMNSHVSGDSSGCAHVDIEGLVLAPGFIDVHSHADFTLPANLRAETLLTQGVTTIVTGNCGWSPFPHRGDGLLQAASAFLEPELDWAAQEAGNYADRLDDAGPAVNVLLQVGHSSLRLAAMGTSERQPTQAELRQMCALLSRAADQGIVGYTTGLTYAPCSYAETDEIVTLARIAAARGLVHATHLRSEGAQLIEAVNEALSIARQTGVKLQISHLKALGTANFGAVHEAMSLVDEALAEGLDIGFDVYPYAASSTTLTSRLPSYALRDGVAGLLRMLADPQQHKRLHDALTDDLGRAFEPELLVIAALGEGADRSALGRSISEIAAEAGICPVEMTLSLLERNSGNVTIVAHAMSLEDVVQVLRHPASSIASDGWVLRTSGTGAPHPRNFGTFPRVLGQCVHAGVLSMPAAIHKMTALPASRYHLVDRGVIRRGATADLVAFDPDNVRDLSDFADPWQLSQGIQHVWLAGSLALHRGEVTANRSGRVIKA